MPSEAGPAEPGWWDAWRGTLFASHKVLRVVEQDLKRHSGLTLPFLDVLSRLYDAPDRRLRMQELQEQALFTFSGMTRLIDRVEQAGFVLRERVPGDRRGVSVALTHAGAEAYESAIERHRSDIEREFGARLTPEQHGAVAQALATFWME